MWLLISAPLTGWSTGLKLLARIALAIFLLEASATPDSAVDPPGAAVDYCLALAGSLTSLGKGSLVGIPFIQGSFQAINGDSRRFQVIQGKNILGEDERWHKTPGDPAYGQPQIRSNPGKSNLIQPLKSKIPPHPKPKAQRLIPIQGSFKVIKAIQADSRSRKFRMGDARLKFTRPDARPCPQPQAGLRQPGLNRLKQL